MTRNSIDDTIAAISTPIGEGGISIVRLSGARSIGIADSIFTAKNGKAPSECASHTMSYGYIVQHDRKIVDEVLLTVMRAPKTYTREDIVEINCHGGIQAAKNVLGLVLKSGARMAEPGEFTKRAYLSGRLDLTQAEAVLDVIRSKTEGSLRVAMGQLGGEISRAVNALRDGIIDIASQVEAAIDFPEEDVEILKPIQLKKRLEDIVERMERLADSFGEGVVLREGVLAVICGKPNVGKSSLMNLLLKRDRVIVSPIPGTTRDSIEELINLKGIPVRIVDTAGIGKNRCRLEAEGIRRSKAYIEEADMALFMLDASSGFGREDEAILKALGGRKKIVIINKTDRGRKLDVKKIRERFKGDRVIEISVTKKRNINLLEDAIAGMIWGGEFIQAESSVVSNARHKELLDKALVNMVSVKGLLEEGASPDIIAIDLKEAVVNLGLIVGKSVSDDILDRIFEQFCIGK